MTVGASSSRLEDAKRSTNEGAEIVMGTTEGVPTTKFVGFENWTRLLVDLRHYAPHVCFTYILIIIFFMHCGQLHAFFGGGINGNLVLG